MRSAAFLSIFLVFGAISFLLFGSLLESVQPGIVFHTGHPGPDEMSRLTLFVLFIMALSYACSEAMVSRMMGPPPSSRRSRIRDYEKAETVEPDRSSNKGGILSRFAERKPTAGAGTRAGANAGSNRRRSKSKRRTPPGRRDVP
ncbi:MAG: hypothetical protein KDK23_04275 [Leptospiraceae bacterium]|nr:hypothetical protein [Leptospiraceae bacterium]